MAETVCSGLRTAVAVFVHRMCILWCKSLSQSLKGSSLTPHEAPELAKLQAESYVGVRQALSLEVAHGTALRWRSRFFSTGI